MITKEKHILKEQEVLDVDFNKENYKQNVYRNWKLRMDPKYLFP